MTANQIAYQQLQETKRSNVAKESETSRSNRAKEFETQRSNRAQEQETQRSNRVNEDIGYKNVGAKVADTAVKGVTNLFKLF